jgi:prepilin-type N-terminal cleavage/methylation domain-containing protein
MSKRTRGKTLHLIRIIKENSGFTLIEVLVALVLLTILSLIALSIYLNYVNKAKVTVAEHAVINVRNNLNLYNIDNAKFPDIINFSDCVDENSKEVFSKGFCDQLKNDLYSISYSYNAENKQYIITARAKDNKLTIMTLTPDKITK